MSKCTKQRIVLAIIKPVEHVNAHAFLHACAWGRQVHSRNFKHKWLKMKEMIIVGV